MTLAKAYAGNTTPTPAMHEQLTTAITTHIHTKLVDLLMLDPLPSSSSTPKSSRFETPLMRFGLDSMLSTELRNWIFTEFGADLRVLELVANNASLADAGRLAVDQVVGQVGVKG